MLSEKLEHLIDKSDKTVEFLVSMNLTQTEIAEEIKRSSDSAERSSGSNLRLTKKIFIWTIVGTLITACGVLYSIHVSQQSVTNSVVESHANKIIDVLTKIENTNSQTQLKPQS